ncbi:MAG: hypothetical protein CL691_01800 [Cellvibrionales bacterium]|nr:hypothetical protein [Cellvibrionales bacterium]|tara:strand:+ start:4050 stop:4517 length:468 start_codon:yes stop_codon:yes gene_type:complete
MSDCHCGKQLSFEDCCQMIINDLRLAKTAEQVMRARYSAYVTGEIDFLHDSLHPDNRGEFDFDSTQQWAESSHWHSLNIIGLKAGTEQDKTGSVDFIAHYTDADEVDHRHCERSQFKRAESSWFFCDGQTIAPEKIGRNDPCSCGSGKKYKKCCG